MPRLEQVVNLPNFAYADFAKILIIIYQSFAIVIICLTCFQVLWWDGSCSPVSSDHQQLRTDALQPNFSTPDHYGESQRARGGLTIFPLCPYAVYLMTVKQGTVRSMVINMVTLVPLLCRNLTSLLIYQTPTSAPTRDTMPSGRNTSVDWIRDVAKRTQNISIKISQSRHLNKFFFFAPLLKMYYIKHVFTVFIIFYSH